MICLPYLTQVNGQIDFIQRHASGQRRTLPPPVAAIYSVFGRVSFAFFAKVTDVTNLNISPSEI